jgi:transcriptional regulator with XRE-family HTH domain
MAISVIDDMNDPEFRKLLAQEELILDFTETICDLLEKEKISRKELADLLGKSKGFVSQLLKGDRNPTLRTVADNFHVLGYKVTLAPHKVEVKRKESNVIKFRTAYTQRKKPVENWEKLEVPRADNDLGKISAIWG